MNDNNASKPIKPKLTGLKRANKRKSVTVFGSKEIISWKCRKCLQDRPLTFYFETTDPFLDTAGIMSICRVCIDDMYDKFFLTEKTMEKTILKLCKILNVRYDDGAIETARKTFSTAEAKGRPIGPVFGLYRKGLLTGGYGGFSSDGDLTYQENVKYEVVNSLPDDIKDSKYLKEFWGNNLDFDDYTFLEKEYSNFKESHKVDTQSEKTLLKLVCFKILEIRKTREQGASTASKEKELQELMKNLAISPQYARAIDEGKNLDAFGVWVAQIEQQEPAQWLAEDGHDMFYDVDDVEGYFQKYFVRPLKNAIFQSKDFNIEDDSDNFEEYDMEDVNNGEE